MHSYCHVSQSAQRYILASEETLSLLYVNASYSERGYFRKRKLGKALPRFLFFGQWFVVQQVFVYGLDNCPALRLSVGDWRIPELCSDISCRYLVQYIDRLKPGSVRPVCSLVHPSNFGRSTSTPVIAFCIILLEINV